ncbi:MAG: GTP-binding protein, partial [Burkholderiales bacterium]|nr:GTP-binding protein [Burkholderiales bacterium]
MDSLIPVTIITGFLGAGKTTLLNRILSEEHGHKVAVIENEFGEVAIDTDLLVKSEDEDIITMSNGCICCTIRGDLAENLVKLAKKKENGETDFERLLIETTGVADPGPITQTFFMDDEVADKYMVDSVITVVDAINGSRTLDESEAAQAQAGFADRILLSKIDIAEKEQVEELTRRLHFINPRAPVIECSMGNIDLNEVLDVHGFNLDNVLELDPDFLKEEAPELCEHHHHDGEECECGHHHDHDHDHEHHHDHDDEHHHDHEEGETCSCGHEHHHTQN